MLRVLGVMIAICIPMELVLYSSRSSLEFRLVPALTLFEFNLIYRGIFYLDPSCTLCYVP
jgi:hypothetical protein